MGMGTLGSPTSKQGFMNGRSMGTSCQRAGFGAIRRVEGQACHPRRESEGKRVEGQEDKYATHKRIEKGEEEWKGKCATHQKSDGMMV